MIGQKIKLKTGVYWWVIVGQADEVYILNDLETYTNNDSIADLSGSCRIGINFDKELYFIEKA